MGRASRRVGTPGKGGRNGEKWGPTVSFQQNHGNGTAMHVSQW